MKKYLIYEILKYVILLLIVVLAVSWTITYNSFSNLSKSLIINSLNILDSSFNSIERVLEVYRDIYKPWLEYTLKELKNYIDNHSPSQKEIEIALEKSAKIVKGESIRRVDYYIINSNGIIIETSYPKDLNLNLKKIIPAHWRELNQIKQGEIYIENVTFEYRTGKLRLFGYTRLRNGNLLEIGLQLTTNILNLLLEHFKEIKHQLQGLKAIQIYDYKLRPLNPNFENLTDLEKSIMKNLNSAKYMIYKSKDRLIRNIYYHWVPKDLQNSNIKIYAKIIFDFTPYIKTYLISNFIISGISLAFLITLFIIVRSIAIRITSVAQSIIDHMKRFLKTKNYAELTNGIRILEELNIKEIRELLEIYKKMAEKIYEDITTKDAITQKLREDIRMIERIAHEYKELSEYDELTGLRNRRSCYEILKKLLDSGIPSTVVFLDLDGLKKINDQFGHEMGDEYLKDFSEAIKKSVRHTDVPCRIGGDEFVIILPGVRKNIANKLCERIKNKTDEIVKVKNRPYKTISFSYGIAESSEFERRNAEEIISTADKRMYEMKKEKKKKMR